MPCGQEDFSSFFCYCRPDWLQVGLESLKSAKDNALSISSDLEFVMFV